ncbi:MAG: ATP-binding protein [Clostridia bacterium]|nr:ATP-binding protein [Clostridia bacterium]
MRNEAWLRVGEMLGGEECIRRLYVSGGNWQLYETEEGGQALAVNDALHQAWLDRGWLEPGIFVEHGEWFVWYAHEPDAVSSLGLGPYPVRREQAEVLVRTLLRSRSRMGRVDFADALYIARFSLLLPTFSGCAPLGDAMVLGRWLTGGVPVPVTDVSRVLRYAPYMTQGALDDMLEKLGMTADIGAAGVMESAVAQEQPVGGGTRSARTEGEFRLPGQPELERFFRDEIIHVVDNEEAYKRMGVGFPGAVLLHGPSGSGKTYAANQLAKYLGWPVYTISSGTVGSKYIHETSRKVSAMFDQAIANAPSILLMDELEAFLSSRDSARSSGEIHMEEVAEFLRRIPDAAQNRVLLIGMTNMIDAIDKAILRKGRFDHVLEVNMPGPDEVRDVLESRLSELPVKGRLPLDDLAEMLAGRPLSDTDFVLRRAGQMAVRAGREYIDEKLLRLACAEVTGEKKARKRMGFF